MCERCAAEYHAPADRRFHAQPTCCPACGPRLALNEDSENPLQAAAELLRHGQILAVKGLGGYHLAADAACEQAVAALRARKHREDNPFPFLPPGLPPAPPLAHSGLPCRRAPSRAHRREPLPLTTGCPRPVLACGAGVKNPFCRARDCHAFVSHHIGDLENAETLRSFTEGIEHFRRLFDIDPEVVAHDLHPEYLSTKYAVDLADENLRDTELAGVELAGAELAGVELAGVQHHHAHIASCLADNGADGPVIGVASDGTGYGTDRPTWGGQFLIADLAGIEPGGPLAAVPM